MRLRIKVAIFALFLPYALAFAPQANAALYSFTTIKLTPCGATGRTGPTTANCTSAYSSQSWTSNTSYFTTNNGIQIWTVPTTGSYTFVIAGAVGGGSSNTTKAAIETATLSLTQGDTISVLVGQMGVTGTANSLTAGGGGGTFVAKGSTALLVAGGSGGQGDGGQGTDASLTTSGYAGAGSGGSAGTNGGGGGGGGFTGGGGGFSGDGGNELNGYAPTNKNLGFAFLNGGYGGYGGQGGGYTGGAHGGFGGGAGVCACSTGGGGGAGGYSGGGGGGSGYPGGGGGGSYIIGTATNTSASIGNTGDGYVIIKINITVPTVPTLIINSGGNSATYRQVTRLKATFNTDVQTVFYQNGKRIPNCQSIQTVSSIAYCDWSPSNRGLVSIKVVGFNAAGSATSSNLSVQVGNRTGKR